MHGVRGGAPEGARESRQSDLVAFLYFSFLAFFGWGKSSRISRNSFGPLIKARLRDERGRVYPARRASWKNGVNG
jgi:hypothetical protein